MFEKHGRNLIALITLLTVLSLVPLRQLKFDFSFEKFFPLGDKDVEFFKEYQKHFHTEIDDEYIFIGLKNNKGIFDRDFLEKVDSLSRFIASLDNILRVYSLTRTGYVFIKDGDLQEVPVIHIARPELYSQDSVVLLESKEYRSLLVSKDGKSIAITAFNSPNLSDKEKDKILENIRQQIDHLGFDETHVAAKIKIERTYVNEIEKNLKLYLIISLILIGLLLLFIFRSFSGIIIPILAIIISVCWTLALIALMNYPLDILSSLIPPILAVICLSNIIHISTRYIEELRNSESKIEALKKTFINTRLAILFSALTTATGFYTLTICNINPIKSFGFFAGTGALMAYLLAAVFVFAVYANTAKPRIVNLENLTRLWTRFLSASFKGLIRKKYWIPAIAILLIAISAYFITRIQVNSSLLQEIPKDNPLLDDYRFIERQFAGTRPFEMALILKDTSNTFLNLTILREIEEVENFLKDSCGVGFMISPVSFVKGANKTFKGGDNAYYQLPTQQNEVYRFVDRMMFTSWGSDLIRFLTPGGRHARISGKLPDLTTKEFQILSDRFDRFFSGKKDSFHFTYKMTGSAVLVDKIAWFLVSNMLSGLLIAFAVISLMVGFLFRSARMVLIVLITNLVPLLMIAAVMGIAGIWLKADTAIIFSVAFGIVVDASIHFISRVKLELSGGRSIANAVKHAYLFTGRAMVITTLVLLAGFGSLLFSSFNGTFYIGLLASLCLIFALASNLTLLPMLILLFYRINQDRRLKNRN